MDELSAWFGSEAGPHWYSRAIHGHQGLTGTQGQSMVIRAHRTGRSESAARVASTSRVPCHCVGSSGLSESWLQIAWRSRRSLHAPRRARCSSTTLGASPCGSGCGMMARRAVVSTCMQGRSSVAINVPVGRVAPPAAAPVAPRGSRHVPSCRRPARSAFHRRRRCRAQSCAPPPTAQKASACA